MNLSVAWVTPFSALSDIGAFSRNLLREWARVAEALDMRVTVVVNEHGETYWSPLPVISLAGDARDRELLASFDVVIFNIGNNSENHQHINRLAIELPGIVIVHDLVMQHYFAFQIFERLRRKDAYARLVAEYYGAAGLDIVGLSQVCSSQGPAIYSPWDTLHVARMPLIEPFAHSAAAVVVHSAFAETAVRAATTAPLLRLALPWDQKPSLDDDEVEAWTVRTKTAPLCRFAAFGHISRNKSLHTMIDAFAASDRLRATARLTIAGYAGDRGYTEELKAQVQRQGLEQIVDFAFDATDAELRQIKHAADAFLNLRYPNTESASGSLVEQMNTGKPVLVFPSGSFAEIPPDAAVAVTREDGVPALVSAMQRVADDPALRIAVGAAGRLQVRRIGAADYIEALGGFIRSHAPLLRARASYGVGRRAAPAPVEAAGEAWLEGVARTRRLLAGLGMPAIDVVPFRDWTDALLLRFVAVGLFGMPLGSRLEQLAGRWLQRLGRAEFYAMICDAMLLFRYARMSSTEFAALGVTEPVLSFAAYELVAAIDRQLFARAAYMGLLRRAPQDFETERYTARAAEESLGRLLGEFARSEEFRGRPGDPTQVQTLLRACEASLPPRMEFPTLSSSQPLEITSRDPQCRRFLLAGWHNVEEGGVWSRGGVATLVFRAEPSRTPSAPQAGPVAGLRPGPRQPDRLRIMTRFAAPSRAPAPPRMLRVLVDGVLVQRHAQHSDEWFTLDLALPRTAEAGCTVELDSGAAVNLKAAGISNDARELGIRLKSIRIEAPQPAASPVPASPPAASPAAASPVTAAPVVAGARSVGSAA